MPYYAYKLEDFQGSIFLSDEAGFYFIKNKEIDNKCEVAV
jgi:hypothetical protein